MSHTRPPIVFSALLCAEHKWIITGVLQSRGFGCTSFVLTRAKQRSACFFPSWIKVKLVWVLCKDITAT